MMLLPTPAEMYRALVERDQSFEGLFFACVRTTGIFCRPTCSARKPKPENVEYASTIQDALHRGYRPCRICDPMSSAASAPNWLAPLVDEMLRNPDIRLRDEELRQRGLDPVQVRRTFKRSFGMTFQAYHRACRLGTAGRSQCLQMAYPTWCSSSQIQVSSCSVTTLLPSAMITPSRHS